MTEQAPLILALLAIFALDLAAFTARTSFLQAGHARLINLREHGPRAERALSLWPRRAGLRAGLNLTLVFTRFSMAALILRLVTLWGFLSPLAAAVVGVLAGGLLTFWAEWLLEQQALKNPEETAANLSGFARALLIFYAPFLMLITNTGADQSEIPGPVTADEVRSLLATGQEEGLIEQEARHMFDQVLDLSKTYVSQIMVPRIDMLALDVETSVHDAVDKFSNSGHSRVPVYDNTVDEITGVVYAKDLLGALQKGEADVPLRNFRRTATFVPESMQANDLLTHILKERVHMAIVVDEYGGVAGLVTLEDILEEFLGEIQDEYDTREEAPYQKLSDGRYTFQGRVTLTDFNEIMESNLSSDDANTLGGYIYAHLGRVPNLGEEITVNGLKLKVEQVTARRIRRVLATRQSPADMKKDEDESVNA